MTDTEIADAMYEAFNKSWGTSRNRMLIVLRIAKPLLAEQCAQKTAEILTSQKKWNRMTCEDVAAAIRQSVKAEGQP